MSAILPMQKCEDDAGVAPPASLPTNKKKEYSLMSYNILAPSYALASFFPDIDPEYLAEQRRIFLLIKQLRKMDADIMCFQEVEKKAIKKSFQSVVIDCLSSTRSFEGVFATRGGIKKDGVAVFWDSNKFSCLGKEQIDFDEIAEVVEKHFPSVPELDRKSNRLFVGKVPKSLSRAVVLKALSTFGDVESFELCPPTKSFFAFGFVIYRHEKARNRAVAQGRVKVNSKNTIFIHHVKKKIITPSSRFRKRNVGQVVVLGATEGKEKRKVVIGNCHLHWCPLLPELKLLQMDRMLKSITQWREKFPDASVILTGDFNSQPHSLVYRLLSGRANGVNDEMNGELQDKLRWAGCGKVRCLDWPVYCDDCRSRSAERGKEEGKEKEKEERNEEEGTGNSLAVLSNDLECLSLSSSSSSSSSSSLASSSSSLSSSSSSSLASSSSSLSSSLSSPSPSLHIPFVPLPGGMCEKCRATNEDLNLLQKTDPSKKEGANGNDKGEREGKGRGGEKGEEGLETPIVTEFSHPLSLVSAYRNYRSTSSLPASNSSSHEPPPSDEPEFTNYKSDFQGCLDYIFYSKQTVKMTGRRPLPILEDVKRYGGLPSEVSPSDHLPLMFSFQFR